jgi:hypothetical protein
MLSLRSFIEIEIEILLHAVLSRLKSPASVRLFQTSSVSKESHFAKQGPGRRGADTIERASSDKVAIRLPPGVLKVQKERLEKTRFLQAAVRVHRR